MKTEKYSMFFKKCVGYTVNINKRHAAICREKEE